MAPVVMALAAAIACGGPGSSGEPGSATGSDTGASLPAADRVSAPHPAPRLILLLVVDQARSDYLDRFRPLFSGGLARLLEHGVFFTEAHHGHARTETGPGHATLATGRYPAHHGIISNDWIDRATGEEIYCVGDRRKGRSPANLKGAALGDWIKQRHPGARVFAASGKDRAAVLLGGHAADGAYWYDRTSGEFMSSDYYRRSSPDWLKAFNHLRIPDKFYGQAWEPLQIVAEPAAFGIREPDQGAFSSALPRALGGPGMAPDAWFYASFYASPFLDEYLAQLAQEIVLQERLGRDDSPDLLALGFSALDPVGHDYGPDSPEALDTLLRLDRALGDLLAFLDREVGADGVLVALSADHGVIPLPELGHAENQGLHRITTPEVLCLQRSGRRLEQRLGPGHWLLGDGYLDRAELARRGRTVGEVAEELAGLVEECPVVRRAWTAAQLEAQGPGADAMLLRFARSHDPERSPDVTVQLQPGVLARWPRGTTHGSPYADDTHVPLLLLAPGLSPARIETPVQTVDLAPTLAALLGLPVPAGLDGRDLSSLLRQTSDGN